MSRGQFRSRVSGGLLTELCLLGAVLQPQKPPKQKSAIDPVNKGSLVCKICGTLRKELHNTPLAPGDVPAEPRRIATLRATLLPARELGLSQNATTARANMAAAPRLGWKGGPMDMLLLLLLLLLGVDAAAASVLVGAVVHV